MKQVFFAIFIFEIMINFNAFGQSKWQNPADRYLDVYKKYLDASSPLVSDEIEHFVYFARNREAIQAHSFLSIPRFTGVQIMYSWRDLEVEKDKYDFSSVQTDIQYLQKYGKKLFIQLQDATFYPQNRGVPDYLFVSEFGGGAIRQRDDGGPPEGWVAKRWNPAVQERFALLLTALGEAFDGKIEGINLQETAIGASYDPTFSPELYVSSIKNNMAALKRAFPHSTAMQYANFMPGEWLPWEDEGYLRSIYEYGEQIGVALGAPDLMVKRRGQLNHALAMMHEGEFTVPLGIAVQDGNYTGETGESRVVRERENIVPLLHSFAKGFLGVKYMFWTYQEPYFTEDVIPCFSNPF